MVKHALVLLALAACGDEQPFYCTTDVDCVADGKAGTCTSDSYCAFTDKTCASGLRYHESAGPLRNQCVGNNANGTPAQPFPLEPMQTFDLSTLHDNITPSCSIPGGRDAFFEITLNDTGRLYIDTLGTAATAQAATARRREAACQVCSSTGFSSSRRSRSP